MATYFDMDGVLADFKAGVERLGVPYVPPDTKDRAADDAIWDAIRATPRFYARLPEIPSGTALFRALQAAGEDPEVLTAVPKPEKNVPKAAGDKCAWNLAHLGPDVKTRICLRAEKIRFCRGPEDVLIDDQERNVREWREAGGTGVLFRGAATRLPPRLEMRLKMAEKDGMPDNIQPEISR